MSDYEVVYDNGVPSSISVSGAYGTTSIPLAQDNATFQQFLKWNAMQAEPLDWKTAVEPPPPPPAEARRMAADKAAGEVDILQTLTYDQADNYINSVILQGFTAQQAQDALTAATTIAQLKAVLSPIVTAIFAIASGMRIIIKILLIIRDKFFSGVYRDN